MEVRRVEHVTKEYRIDFTDEHGSGCSFPCDERGNIDFDGMNPAALKNYKNCMAHPELYQEFNEFKVYTNRYVEKTGTCDCGHEMEVYDQYQGACQCPECGRWYNLFGQRLNPPEMWEEDY